MDHDLGVPEWLNIDFLNQCLQSKEIYKNTSVTKFFTEPAVAPGNNFGSNILRVKLYYIEKSKQSESENSLSLIVKSPLSADHSFFDDFYSSEPKFYNQFLPEVYKLLTKKFAPDSFFSPLSLVVVLEDLKVQDYQLAERSKQLDFEHCRAYMIAAATFHAVSFAVHKQNPELVISMSKEKMFSSDLKSAKSTKLLLRYSIEYLADSVLQIQVDKEIYDCIKDCCTTLWDMLVKAHKPNEEFNCLNQGDPWTTNMMFKYENGENPSNIKILDFQNLRFASPVCDLTFFIWSSANHEVRENRLEDLYSIYLSALNSCLLELNCSETLTQEIFRKHLLALSPMALWTVAVNLPFMLNPLPTDLSALQSRLNEEYTPTNNPYKNYYFESYIPVHLLRLVKQLDATEVFKYLKCKQKE